jgi:hypothetical protein
VVTMLVCFFISHARPRVHWAPGFPCSPLGAALLPSVLRSERFMDNSGASRSEIDMAWQRHCLRQTRSVCARERMRRSNPLFLARQDGLLRGACHRARVRATRWLAMTAVNCLMNASAPHSPPSSPANAGDPVFQSGCGVIETPRRTGYPLGSRHKCNTC